MAVARQRTWRRAGAVGLVLALAAGLSVATLTGTRERAAALQLLSGDAWLANRATGSVSNVLGYGKRSDPPVRVSSARDPFTIVQRPDGAYVLDTRTGVLTRVGASTLGVTASRQLPGEPSALRVSSGGTVTWVLDASSGLVQQVDPTTLSPAGPQTALGGPVGSTLTDSTGTLWAARPGAGTVDHVAPDGQGVKQQSVGQVGDILQLVDTTDGVWAVDPQAGTVVSLSHPTSAAAHIPQTAPGATAPVVASSPTSADVVVVSGAVVSDVNTATGSVSTTSDPQYSLVTEAVLANGQVYLLDPGSNVLDVLSLDPVARLGQVMVPPGSDQLIAHDNLVFVNDDGSPAAAVVDGAGQVTPITKYQVAPTPTPGPNPDPNGPPQVVPAPVPAPTPSAYPTGPGPTPAPVSPTPTPTPSTPPTPTTVATPSAPGTPSVVAVSPGATTLTVRWQAGSGPAPSGYALMVTPRGGGSPISTDEAAATTQAVVAGLARGTTYCAQIQALGASSGSGSPLSPINVSLDCATTTAAAPGGPTNLSFVPGFDVVDVTFGAAAGAPAGTTYTATLGSDTVKGITPGTHQLTLHVPSGTYTTGTLSVYATDGGGNGPTVTLPVWSYWVGANEGCLSASPTGNWYTLGAGDACPKVETPALTYDDTPEGATTLLPTNPAERTMCHYGSTTTPAPAGGQVALYLVSAPGQTACPAPPAGFGPGTIGNIVWETPGSTHTTLVEEWQGTEADGTVEYVFTGPNENYDTVAGQALTNAHVYLSWYDDPSTG